MFSSQGIGSGLVSFYMIFEALQSALFGFNFHSLSLKTLKIPEFNLVMAFISGDPVWEEAVHRDFFDNYFPGNWFEFGIIWNDF